MASLIPTPAPPRDPAQARERLLALLHQEPRGVAQRHNAEILQLITTLEREQSADLAQPQSLELLEGVWELRWSSSRQPYLAVQPWLENLQLLLPSQGRGMNLLRPSPPFTPLACIAVETAIAIASDGSTTAPLQRVQVRFHRGGWLGPPLGGKRLQLLRRVQQPFPAWLDITVLDDELRVCRGNAGTLFALLRRRDCALEDLLLPLEESQIQQGGGSLHQNL